MLLAVANNNRRHFGHHCRWRASPISIKHRGQYKLINQFLHKFYDSIKTVRRWRRKKYAEGCPTLQRHGFIKSTPLEGQAAPPPW